jgi:hypothetical protein
MISVLSEVFNEFIGAVPTVATLAIGVVFFCIFLNSLCFCGLIAVPQLLQTLLCLIWVYGCVRNVIMLGILAWYADVPPGYSFWETVSSNTAQPSEALWIRPALALHLFCTVFRPLVLLLHTFHSSSAVNPAVSDDDAVSECEVEPKLGTEHHPTNHAQSHRGRLSLSRKLSLSEQGMSFDP